MKFAPLNDKAVEIVAAGEKKTWQKICYFLFTQSKSIKGHFRSHCILYETTTN